MFKPMFPQGDAVRLAHENKMLRQELDELARKVSELACVVHPLLAYGTLTDTSAPKVTSEDPPGQ